MPYATTRDQKDSMRMYNAKMRKCNNVTKRNMTKVNIFYIFLIDFEHEKAKIRQMNCEKKKQILCHFKKDGNTTKSSPSLSCLIHETK